MSKLEQEMDRIDADMGRAARDSEAAWKRGEEKKRRDRRLYERREFNRLFKRLRGMVEGHWDRYGHGWKFKYRGGDFYIGYEDWFSPKTPGDVDDYDASGTHWVLKLGFNGIQGRTLTLSREAEPKGDLTGEVMDGLRELAKKFANAKGRFYPDDGD